MRLHSKVLYCKTKGPVELNFAYFLTALLQSIFSHLGTFKSSIAPPTPSVEEAQETVEMEIRDLNIDEVLFQLSLFCTTLFEQKRVIERK